MAEKADSPDSGVDAASRREGSSAGLSVTQEIQRIHGPVSRVILRDETDYSPLVRVRVKDGPESADDDSRYQVLGEIARGGVGIVFKSRDADLGRDVALKVLRSEFADKKHVIDRFIEEAQIGGQLQHPGIVPVYGIGLQQDGRPHFAMKLVKGDTLTALLQDKKDTPESERRFLLIFKQVCETIGFAHSRGVVHRDLKPSNIMVGAFGEVQVVDWGFAKVLGREDTAARVRADASITPSIIATVRTAEEGSHSIAGSVMGTPGYMPPEQALGRVDDLDERSDVFGLGAILAEILTGQAPYVGEGNDPLIMAAQAKLDDAYGRLDGCGANEEIVGIAKSCLSPLMADRPKDGGAVADLLSGYLAGTEGRAQQAEIAAAKERAGVESERLRLATERRKAISERRTRRVTLLLAASVLLLASIGGGGILIRGEILGSHASQAASDVSEALNEAKRLRGEREWEQALAAAERAAELARVNGAEPAWLERAEDLVLRLEEDERAALAAAKVAAADDALAARLEEIGLQLREDVGAKKIDADYAAAFAERGIDLTRLSAEQAAERFRDSGRATDIADAFGDWAYLRRWASGLESSDWEKPATVGRLIDAESEQAWRAILERDLTSLRAIASSPDALELGPRILGLLGQSLSIAGDPEAGTSLLERAWRRYPDGLLVNFNLARARDPRGASTSVGDWKRHMVAASVLRPESAEVRHLQGDFYNAESKADRALEAWRAGLALDPRHVWLNKHLFEAHLAAGEIDVAKALVRDAIQASPDVARHRLNLAHLHQEQGELEAALAAVEEAVRLSPDWRQVHTRHARLLSRMGRRGEALTAARKAIRCEPKSPSAHRELAQIHLDRREWKEALAAIEKACELDQDNTGNHSFRATCLSYLDDPESEERAHRENVERFRDNGYFLERLVNFLVAQERTDDAITACRAEMERNPYWHYPHVALGIALDSKGEPEAAVASIREGIRLGRYDPAPHVQLVYLLRRLGDHAGATAAAEEAARLAPSSRITLRALAFGRLSKGDVGGAVQALREAWRRGGSVNDVLTLTDVLRSNGRNPEAVRELEAAVRKFPANAVIHRQLGLALYGGGRLPAAVEHLREAVRLDPDDGRSALFLGHALTKTGAVEEAIEAYEAAARPLARGRPSPTSDRWNAHVNLASIYQRNGSTDRALAEVRAAHRLFPDSWDTHEWLVDLLESTNRLDDELAALRKKARETGGDPGPRVDLGEMLFRTGDLEAAESELRRAVDTEPATGRALLLLGATIVESGRPEESIPVLSRAAEAGGPHAGLAHHYLGRAQLELARVDDALESHGEGARLASSWARGHQWRANALAHDGQLEAAVKAAVKGASGKASWRALLLLSSLREISGEDLLAEDALERALRIAPNEPRVLRRFAMSRMGEREFEKAVDAWRRTVAAAKASPRPDASFIQSCERALRDCARLAKLDERWEEIESGEFEPKDGEVMVLCAELAASREEFALAARLLGRSLEKSADLDERERTARLFDVAVYAARAGSWEGATSFNLSDEAAAKLRSRALGWFRELLETRRKQSAKGDRGRELLWEVARWRMLESLSGVREREGLERFPGDEAKEWAAFWGELDQLFRQLRKGKGT